MLGKNLRGLLRSQDPRMIDRCNFDPTLASQPRNLLGSFTSRPRQGPCRIFRCRLCLSVPN